MDDDIKKELDIFKNNLSVFAEELCNAHKLASMLNKYCKAYIDNDDLYEISHVVELLEKKLDKIGFDFYLTIQDNAPKSIKDVMQNIKSSIEAKKIEFVD